MPNTGFSPRPLHDCAATVVVSGYASDLYDRELFADWHRYQLPAATSQGGTWKDRMEVLWSNRPLNLPNEDAADLFNGTEFRNNDRQDPGGCYETRCAATDCQKVMRQAATGRRDMLATSIGGLEHQPERLRQHLDHITSEIQRQQQPLLSQRLEPVMTPCGNQILQPRSMPLPFTPPEPTHRQRTLNGNPCQIACCASDFTIREPPRHRPPSRPLQPQTQPSPQRIRNVRSQDQINETALVREHPNTLTIFVA